MVNEELLEQIEPQIEQAYAEHMHSISSRDPNGEITYKRPFSPVNTLADAAGTSTDPLDYGEALRKDHESNITRFNESLGIDVRPVLAASFLINLLTEDNLPHYTSRIHSKVNQSPALSVFANEWTAEEATHGLLMRDYALLTGLIGDDEAALISHAQYDSGRTSQLKNGTEINPPDLQHAFAYLTLQELLTKEAHNKLGWLLAPSGQKAMRPISGDEQNHYEFYRKANKASLDADPDGTLLAMHSVYSQFSMPGKLGIPEFDNHALTIGISGIFDLKSIAQSKRTIINKLNIEHATPSSDAAKQAQELLINNTSDRAIHKEKRFMERLRDNMPSKLENGLTPFILGKTIDFTYAGAPGHERPTGLVAITA